MLSRRNVRVKVMQALYAQSRDETMSDKQVVQLYWKKIDASFELLLFSLYNIIQIATIAMDDLEKRKTKHLPSDIDKKFEPKLWTNAMIQALEKNRTVQLKFDKLNFASKVDKDHFRTIYFDFAKEEIYLQYILSDSSHAADLEILLELFRFCRKNEIFNEIIEDHYNNWEDDKSIIIGTIKKVLKDLTSVNENFIMDHYPDAETIKDYGEYLLLETIKAQDLLKHYIEPVLHNWDAERIAILDMIMLKMAISEFIHCPTIPTKVTLNEYVELAKNYSTSKSKEFVNGILDRLLNELIAQGKIVKEGRGLLEE